MYSYEAKKGSQVFRRKNLNGDLEGVLVSLEGKYDSFSVYKDGKLVAEYPNGGNIVNDFEFDVEIEEDEPQERESFDDFDAANEEILKMFENEDGQ